MEQLLFSLNATIPVFLVMVIGYVLQQLHVTNDSFVKTLNSFNYKITLPVLCSRTLSTADFYSVMGYRLRAVLLLRDLVLHRHHLGRGRAFFIRTNPVWESLSRQAIEAVPPVLGIAFIQNIYRELRHGLP